MRGLNLHPVTELPQARDGDIVLRHWAERRRELLLLERLDRLAVTLERLSVALERRAA